MDGAATTCGRHVAATNGGRRDILRPEFSVFGFQFSAGGEGNWERSSPLISAHQRCSKLSAFRSPPSAIRQKPFDHPRRFPIRATPWGFGDRTAATIPGVRAFMRVMPHRATLGTLVGVGEKQRDQRSVRSRFNCVVGSDWRCCAVHTGGGRSFAPGGAVTYVSDGGVAWGSLRASRRAMSLPSPHSRGQRKRPCLQLHLQPCLPPYPHRRPNRRCRRHGTC
jgi:hypothetical protein